jgi:hypothetical protein
MSLSLPVMEVAAAEASDDSSLVHDVTVGSTDTILGAAEHLAALVLSLLAGEEIPSNTSSNSMVLDLLVADIVAYLDILSTVV